jgi:3-oxoacyl-[acyl-carrier protein] reductase
MDLGVKGLVAMVAGGSAGLGYATASVLAAEGAHVSIFARPEGGIEEAGERLRKETGAEVLVFAGDLRKPADIPAWSRATIERFGRVDMLFANTGGPPPGFFESVTDEGWQSGVELLLFPIIRMAREVIPLMKAGGGGSIVLSTSSAVKVPILNLTLSTVIRSAVSALSRTLAEQYAADGIRVNQIVPGRIDTDRVRSLDKANAERAGIPIEEQRARTVASIPMGRYGRPEEFGKAAAFLLSSQSSFITGATLQVDGGMIKSVL